MQHDIVYYMSQVPEYYEYVKTTRGEKSDLQPFSYVQASQSFMIGDKEVPLQDFDPFEYNPYKLFGLDFEGIEVDEMSKHALLLPSLGEVLGGPKLLDWTKHNPVVVSDVFKVMHEAFVSLVDNPEEVQGERGGSHMGFNSGLREDGAIALQVIGNCACLGPGWPASRLRDQFEHGYVEYELHNADMQPQRAALYAGIGHLARLADQAT